MNLIQFRNRYLPVWSYCNERFYKWMLVPEEPHQLQEYSDDLSENPVADEREGFKKWATEGRQMWQDS